MLPLLMTVSSKLLREQVALSLPMLVAFVSVSGIGKILRRTRSTQVSIMRPPKEKEVPVHLNI